MHNGDIRFDDNVLKATHRVDQLELGIPFLANLPSSTDVFVKPLLAARVDGSPLRIDGQTKPFADSLESSIAFQLDHLDLPRYLGYVPVRCRWPIPQGTAVRPAATAVPHRRRRQPAASWRRSGRWTTSS